MPAVKKELPGREDLALALATFHPTLAALPLPPLPGYLTPLPAAAALPPAASLPAATAGYEALLAPPLRSPRAYLSLHEASPHLHLPRDPLALERFSATAAAAPDFQPLLDNGEPCIEVECGANRALLYVRKLCQGSKGPSIRHRGEWLTPNEFQFVSGRETAKDWKRSIRHKGAAAVGAQAATVPPLGSPRTPGSGPPHSATWETPSPPREGAATLGLPQGHPPPRPQPGRLGGPEQSALDLHGHPSLSRCALGSQQHTSRPLLPLGRSLRDSWALWPRGSLRELGRLREAGWAGHNFPSRSGSHQVLAGVEGHTGGRGAGASCWREEKGVGVLQAGGGRGGARRGGGARGAGTEAGLGAACLEHSGVWLRGRVVPAP